MGIMLLWNDVLDHEKSFNEYLHFVGAGQNDRAAESARTLLRGVRTTLEKIQREYPDLVIESRMPDYPAVRELFEGTPPSGKELARLASKLQSFVHVMEGEVRRHRKKEKPKWLQFLGRQRKTALIGLGAVAGLWILVWGVSMFLHRGQGLVGEYYGDMELGVFYKTRIDRQVNFGWLRDGPFKGWRRDRFSVRWNGYLHIPEAGFYDLYVHVDDGARLYLDNVMVLDDWNVAKVRVLQVSKQLEGGYHPIRLDYYERGKDATIRLFWRRPGMPRPEPIPARFLIPSEKYFKEGVPVHAQPVDDDEEPIEGETRAGQPPSGDVPAAAGEED